MTEVSGINMLVRLDTANLKLKPEYDRTDTAKILRVRRQNMRLIVASSTLSPDDDDMFKAKDISLFIDEFLRTDVPKYPPPAA